MDTIAVEVRLLIDLPAGLAALGLDLLIPPQDAEGQVAMLGAGVAQEVLLRGLAAVYGPDWALTRAAYRVTEASPVSVAQVLAWRMGASMVE